MLKIMGYAANGTVLRDPAIMMWVRSFDFHTDPVLNPTGAKTGAVFFALVTTEPALRSIVAALPGVTVLESAQSKAGLLPALVTLLQAHGIVATDDYWTVHSKLYAKFRMPSFDPNI